MSIPTNNVFRGTLSGWQVFSTEGPSSIPQPFIRDTAQILETMRSTGTIKRLLECISLLNFHIGKDDIAHDFSLDQFATMLLYNLFCKYRQLGHLTDQEEMYVRLFYDQKLAQWNEVYSGTENTKAINVPKFRWIFDQHNSDLDAHHGIFSQFLPKTVCPYDPTISLLSMFNGTDLLAEYTDESNSITYPLNHTNWSTEMGTFTFFLNFVIEENSGYQTIFTLYGPRYRLTLQLSDTHILELQVYDSSQDSTIVLFSFDLELFHGKMGVSMTYDKSRIGFYFVSNFQLDAFLSPITTWDFTSLKLSVPLMDADSFTSLSSLVYYPRAMFDKNIQSALLA